MTPTYCPLCGRVCDRQCDVTGGPTCRLCGRSCRRLGIDAPQGRPTAQEYTNLTTTTKRAI